MSFVDSSLLSEPLQQLQSESPELTPEEMERLYASAFSFYQMSRYTQAIPIFERLLLYRPYEARFWRGLAASRQMATRTKEALCAWAALCLLSERAASDHFHAAECLLALGEKAEALKALHLAEKEMSSSDPLSARVALLKERVCG